MLTNLLEQKVHSKRSIRFQIRDIILIQIFIISRESLDAIWSEIKFA